VALGGDQAIAESFERAAASLDMPLHTISDSREGGRELYDRTYVLVRPDQFVAWAGDNPPENIAAVLAGAAGGWSSSPVIAA
jgi:hypothetical protein